MTELDPVSDFLEATVYFSLTDSAAPIGAKASRPLLHLNVKLYSISHPTHPEPVLRRIAPACGARSASPPALWSPPPRRCWEKTEKEVLKRGQNEKNCSHTSPWTRGLWLNLESAGQSRTPPSGWVLSQHKTIQEHATSPADWWEGGRRNWKCVVGGLFDANMN